jgi:ribose 1,5-bisphosphokinase PhnN
MSSLAHRLAAAPSLRFGREPPRRITAIVIVGSTCAGKTTLANAIRRAALAGVDVPRRFVTRAPRPDDVADEAGYVTCDELDGAITAGRVRLHWSRTLEAGHLERYGFATPRAGALPVYSANNAICTAVDLSNALVVGVFAPDELRARRLRARSPALCAERPDEVSARLGERADVVRSHAHVVIENHGTLEPSALRDIVELVRACMRRH